MVLLPGTSISTSTAKRDEQQEEAQRRRHDSDSSSTREAPPPPYPHLPPGLFHSSVNDLPTPIHRHLTEMARGCQLGGHNHALSHDNQHHHHHGHWRGRRFGHGHAHVDGAQPHAGRRCGRSREHKRRFFRRVLARFIITSAVVMLWLHFDDVRQGVDAVMACMPSFVITALHLIGTALYAPIALSQTFGVLLYSAFAAFAVTAMHVKMRQHRRAKWHSRWTEAARARHAAVHDREAYPGAPTAEPLIHHHDHHQQHHPHGTPPSFEAHPVFVDDSESQSTDLEEEKSVSSH